MLAGRCRCGAGKFLSCGCAGAREDELPVPRAGNGQCQTPPAKQHLGGIGTRQKGCSGSWDTAGVMSWCHECGFILNPAVFAVHSALGSEHSELWILGSGWDGLPAWLRARRANGIREYSLGEEKKRLGASMGLRRLISCAGSGKHRLLSLARRKLGASGGVEGWLC